MKKAKKEKVLGVRELEKIYSKYLMPMPLEDWQNVKSLEQPNMLKEVPMRTGFSMGDL
jgi:hypothetical protein